MRQSDKDKGGDAKDAIQDKPLAFEAKEHLRKLVMGKPLKIEVESTENYAL